MSSSAEAARSTSPERPDPSPPRGGPRTNALQSARFRAAAQRAPGPGGNLPLETARSRGAALGAGHPFAENPM